MTQTEALVSIGKALWGDHWITPMSEALKVNARTVRYWVERDSPPPGIWKELNVLCRDRIPLIVSAMAEAEKQAAA